MPFDNYLLPPFQGLLFVLLGFDNDSKEKLKEKIIKTSGIVLDETKKESFENKQLTIIVLNSENAHELYNNLKQEKKTEGKTIVIHDWIEACILTKQAIPGAQYSCKELFEKKLSDSTKQNNKPGYALEEEAKKLENLQPNDEKGLFLSDCIIYCEKLESAEERKNQKRLIVLAGGSYFESYCKAITHVVVNSVSTKNEYKENIMDYTMPPYLVFPQWLKDCIVKKAKMPEEKYKPLISGTSDEPITFANKIKSSTSQQQNSHIQASSNMSNSLLFKDITFCINDTSYPSEKAQDIAHIITKHSGKILKSTKVNYMIVNDGYDKNAFKDYGKVKDQPYLMVSHRWIDYCIKHKQIVSVERNRQIYLLPLPFNSPYKDIEKFIIGLTGLKPEDKIVIGRIYEAMGGKVEKELNKSNVIISDKNAAGKALDAQKRNPKISVVDANWLLDYLELGISPDPEKYKLKIEIK